MPVGSLRFFTRAFYAGLPPRSGGGRERDRERTPAAAGPSAGEGGAAHADRPVPAHRAGEVRPAPTGRCPRTVLGWPDSENEESHRRPG